MKKIRKRPVGKIYSLTFLAILVLTLLFWSHAESQNVPSQGERRKGHPKIENSLIELLEGHTDGGLIVSQGFARDHGIELDQEGMITVFLLPEAGRTRESIDAKTLAAYGGKVIKTGDAVIKAKVPVSMLDRIADDIQGLSFIRPPDRPHAEVISEGVNLTGASSYPLSGYGGENVKVAIIDLGFDNLSTAIAAGVLPDSVIRIDCTGAGCVSTNFSYEGEVHGTAVAEIVHEMTPGSQLYLIKINDTLDLKDAKDYCIANGIKIINHSVGWFNTNFYDGTCYFDNAVCSADDAYAKGILWVNAAGNYGQGHYEATFSDPNGNGWHNVSEDNECISIRAGGGTDDNPIIVHLTWDAWPASDQDYDLYLYLSGRLKTSSVTMQTGTQEPTESIFYSVNTSGTYCLKVKKSKATSNHRFKIFSLNHDLSPNVAASSLSSPADAMNVMAVAAIDWAKWTTGPQEDFSSQGPTSDGRIKPDISGPDRVSNYLYGSFAGTSAAAPHVAGAAALVLSAHPSYSVSQLRDVLTSSAVDMGDDGQDDIYGFGRLNLPEPPLPPPCISSVSPDRWRGEYFNNRTLEGSPSMVRDDGAGFLSFDLGTGSPSTACGVGTDNFSVRWTRTADFVEGTYRFTVTSDDGVRVYVDDQLALDKWSDHAATTYTADVSVAAGNHTLRVEYYEHGGEATAKVSWQRIPASRWINIGLGERGVKSLAIDPQVPDTLYAGTSGGGVFKSTDGGTSWTTINAGLAGTNPMYVNGLAVDPQSPETLYAGTRGGVFKSTDGGASWTAVNTGLTRTYVNALAMNSQTPNTLYVGTKGGVFKSTNSGMTWAAVNTGLTRTYVNTLAIDPQTPDILYAGTSGGGVFKSTNGGTKWTAIKSGLTGFLSNALYVNALAVDPQTPNTLYAGTRGGVFKSTNGGMSWTAINTGLAGIFSTSSYVNGLAVDPVTPDILYAGTKGGAFMSTNGGTNWTAVNTGLTRTYVNVLAIDPEAPNTLYAGTSGGVFKFE